MSREVRRVPLDWKHPTEPNPYWLEQGMSRRRRGAPESKLHGPAELFVSLLDGYSERLADWEQEHTDLLARTGHEWTWHLEYNLTGYQGRDDSEPVAHPFYQWSADGMTEIPVTIRDADHLYELLVPKHAEEKPAPQHYMPEWPGHDDLGWCLYETVSEGTPVTPVFATAEELIDHLATVGQDWNQEPMRRAAAESLVRSGSSLGSLIVIGGQVLSSSDDADIIAAKLGSTP
jgi:hypothetical protein